jgi:FKBP-type peptidyl-prolyl cis-trans isomerase
MAVAGIALFVVGLVVGAAVNSHHAQIAAQQKQITAQQKQIHSLRQSIVTADAQAASARAKMSKAQAQSASREAAVRKLQRQLQHEHAVAAPAAGTGTTPQSSASPAPAVALGCKVLQTGTSEEFDVTTTGGGSYRGTVNVSFYGPTGSGQVFPGTTVNGATPTAAWHQVPAADIGASAEPIGCTASAG